MPAATLISALESALSGLDPAARLGVAVSGGGDSVAALVLLAEVLGPGRVAAATVDHGLRAGSAAEARAVAVLCARLGVQHRTLVWDGAAEASGNLMDAARRARGRLLSAWARGLGLPAVVLGHTRDDQAETVLMRLARGSGVDGLSGMAPHRRAGGVVWLRPFLDLGRDDLRAVLRARGIGWTEDPTNSDDRFTRTRARAALAALAPLGIDARGLAATAGRMARARAALEGEVARARARHLRDEGAVVRLDAGALDLPGEIRDRLLAGLIRAVAGAPYPPRLAALHRLVGAVSRDGGAATLGGVALRRTGAQIHLWREARAVLGVRCPAGALWDGRWRATGPAHAGAGIGAEIGALGQAGLVRLSRQARAGLHPHWRETGLPEPVLAALPGIWRGDALIAAPLALWPQGWRLDARPLAAGPDHSGEFD